MSGLREHGSAPWQKRCRAGSACGGRCHGTTPLRVTRRLGRRAPSSPTVAVEAGVGAPDTPGRPPTSRSLGPRGTWNTASFRPGLQNVPAQDCGGEDTKTPRHTVGTTSPVFWVHPAHHLPTCASEGGLNQECRQKGGNGVVVGIQLYSPDRTIRFQVWKCLNR